MGITLHSYRKRRERNKGEEKNTFFSTRIMESNNFYRSYMAAFEMPSSINQERRTSSVGCRTTFGNIVGLSSTSTSERISYLLPYSSKEGVYNVLPAEQNYFIVKNSAPQVRV